jgi:hypothetical protein
MVNCGISMAINERFFNELLKDLLPALLKLVKQSFLLGKTFELDLEMFRLYLVSPQIIVNEIDYDTDLTRFDTYSENNSFGFHIVDSNLNVTLNYDIFIDPPILDDRGTLAIGYNDLNINVILGMKEGENGEFVIEVSESSFYVPAKSFYLDIDNENDFVSLYGTVVDAILPPVVNLIGTALSEYLQTIVDLALGYIPSPITLAGISLDLGFYEFPNVTADEFITSTWIGKVFPEGGDVPFKNVAQLPKLLPDGKDFQLFISDYTLRSAFYTIVELDLINISIDNSTSSMLNTNFLGTFFPELIKYYGKNKPAELSIKADDKVVPDLTVTQKGIDASFSLIMTVGVDPESQLNSYQEAFSFKVNTKLNAIIDVSEDLRVMMKINDLNIDVVEIVNSNIGDVDVKKVNNILKLLVGVIKGLVNVILSRGIDIGALIQIPIVLKNIVIAPANGYYMIQANPYLNQAALKDPAYVTKMLNHHESLQ